MQNCCDELMQSMLNDRRKFPSNYQRKLACKMGQDHHVFRHAYGFLKNSESDRVSSCLYSYFSCNSIITSITVSHSQVWVVFEQNCPPKLGVSSGTTSCQISKIVQPDTGCPIHCNYCSHVISLIAYPDYWDLRGKIQLWESMYPCRNNVVVAVVVDTNVEPAVVEKIKGPRGNIICCRLNTSSNFCIITSIMISGALQEWGSSL